MNFTDNEFTRSLFPRYLDMAAPNFLKNKIEINSLPMPVPVEADVEDDAEGDDAEPDNNEPKAPPTTPVPPTQIISLNAIPSPKTEPKNDLPIQEEKKRNKNVTW